MKPKKQENLKYFSGKEIKAKPHMKNTKCKATTAGKLNWN